VAERPRDRLGRPLPFASDRGRHAPTVPVAMRSPAETLRVATEYFNAGLPFHAHEVFEQQWRATSGPDRIGWRALAQFGAAVTQLLRGNDVGGNRLLERAALGLSDSAGLETTGLDVAGLIRWCRDATRDLTEVPTFGSVVETTAG
jgi:hypothetical protein